MASTSSISILIFLIFFMHVTSSTTMDPSNKIFFTIDDLTKGKTLTLYISPKSPSTTPPLLTKQQANSYPFSSFHLPYLLQLFSIPNQSPQAQAMNYTISVCELKPIKGETKLCVTSLESMLDFTRGVLGLDAKLKVLKTSFVEKSKKPLENYTIVESPREVFARKMVACHTMPYPYKVFYCHSQGGNRVFEVLLESEDGGRVEALSVCHVDTSHWDKDHVSFRVLKTRPGRSSVCHLFPVDNLVWVPDY